jgi:hypothetical protein
LDSLPIVLIFDATKKSHIALKQRIMLPAIALGFDFDRNGNLWVGHTQSEKGPLISVCRYLSKTSQVRYVGCVVK